MPDDTFSLLIFSHFNLGKTVLRLSAPFLVLGVSDLLLKLSLYNVFLNPLWPVYNLVSLPLSNTALTSRMVCSAYSSKVSSSDGTSLCPLLNESPTVHMLIQLQMLVEWRSRIDRLRHSRSRLCSWMPYTNEFSVDTDSIACYSICLWI